MPLAVADRRSGSTAVKARRSRRMQQRATATGESEERTHWIEERVLNRIPRRILNCAFICLSHLSLISLHLSTSLCPPVPPPGLAWLTPPHQCHSSRIGQKP